MDRKTWLPSAAAPVLTSALALLLAGCGGSGDGGARVPTADSGLARTAVGQASDGGTTTGDDVASYVKGQQRWVDCLRAKGLDVPDPDARGNVDLGDGAALKQDPTSRAALEKCSRLKPPVPESILQGLRPKLTASQIKTERRYATCMQNHGAPDFPDPGSDGYAPAGAHWDQQTAGALRATRICAPIIGDPTDRPAGEG